MIYLAIPRSELRKTAHAAADTRGGDYLLNGDLTVAVSAKEHEEDPLAAMERELAAVRPQMPVLDLPHQMEDVPPMQEENWSARFSYE